jgi:hypothetical protein
MSDNNQVRIVAISLVVDQEGDFEKLLVEERAMTKPIFARTLSEHNANLRKYGYL